MAWNLRAGIADTCLAARQIECRIWRTMRRRRHPLPTPAGRHRPTDTRQQPLHRLWRLCRAVPGHGDCGVPSP